ncbi:MAG: hypothetical protein ACI87A_000474, partial [Planctomycetota bacterium]
MRKGGNLGSSLVSSTLCALELEAHDEDTRLR